MFIDADSLQVKRPSDTNYINLGKDEYITEARYGFNKVWADDTGRNLSGKMSGTLIGIFPKIVVSFAPLTKTQIETITPILDAPNQLLKYYDPTKQQTITMETYTGDYEIPQDNIVDENSKSQSFEISFIAIAKRS
jgi:hypothetical protein